MEHLHNAGLLLKVHKLSGLSGMPVDDKGAKEPNELACLVND